MAAAATTAGGGPAPYCVAPALVVDDDGDSVGDDDADDADDADDTDETDETDEAGDNALTFGDSPDSTVARRRRAVGRADDAAPLGTPRARARAQSPTRSRLFISTA